MIKKLIIFLLGLFPFHVCAQLEVGNWKLYQTYSGLHMQNIVDAGNIVYYLADGWLYAYDKDNDESVYYNKRNDLSDNGISNIFYNYEKNYLLIAYSNSNIDLLYDSGKVVNMPDLKNAVMNASKTINSVDFKGDNIYVATDFGYMVLDDEQYLVKESFNYGKRFYSMIATEKYIYANFDSKTWVSGIDDNHFYINSFKVTNFVQEAFLQKISDERFFTRTGWLYTMKIGEDPANLGISTIEQQTAQLVTKSKDGYIASFKGYYMPLTAEGISKKDGQGKAVKITLPSDFEGSLIASMETDGSVWGADKKGIKQFKIEDGGITYLHENFRPNATTVSQPYYMTYKNSRLYSMSGGPNMRANSRSDFGLSSLQNGVWKDLAPEGNIHFVNEQSKGRLLDSSGLTIDPDDPDMIWFGSWWEGAFCVKNNQLVHKVDHTNSPMILNYVCNIADMAFDGNKNLWMLSMNYLVPESPELMILPRDKQFNKAISKKDWISYPLGSVDTHNYARLFMLKNNLIYVIHGDYPSKLVALDYKGTVENKADDSMITLTSFTDQDGKVYDMGYIFCLVQEDNGKIWIGSSNGVGYISDPKTIFSNNFHLSRVKVPRNDGTNQADYLLNGITVNTIVIDGANRKWIGTATSGAYLVSEDGTEILEHFTAENSYLPDNNVLSIECSDDSNIVYFGTKKGTVEYSSDAVVAEENYDNVYAYPNPVRPDYTGYITVKGLMDNSLVKIADAAGNVVFSKRSTGGMVVWDGCNLSGQRVNTGVYYVLASQSENGDSSGCVAKILVVR